jgi:Uma2 family endonuclease
VSFADLERAPDDGRRYELYDGEICVVPAPILLHQVVQYALAEELRRICRQHGGFAVGSPIDVVFSEHDVLQPDVVYFRPARMHLLDLDSAIRHAPDLCVEILSPSTEATDRGRKMQMFARYGVPEYWIVDPVHQTIEVHRLERGGYVLAQCASGDEEITSAVLPGAALRAGRIFPEPSSRLFRAEPPRIGTRLRVVRPAGAGARETVWNDPQSGHSGVRYLQHLDPAAAGETGELHVGCRDGGSVPFRKGQVQAVGNLVVERSRQ